MADDRSLRPLSPAGALNAFEFDFDESTLSPLRRLYRRQVAPRLPSSLEAVGRGGRLSFGTGGHGFHAVGYGPHLLWFSSDNEKTHNVFQRWFDAAGVARHLQGLVSHDERIVMYCGFFIVSMEFPETKWHVDYEPGANAYTLLTPLFELAPEDGRLLYEIGDQRAGRYEYRCGKGVLIGEQFTHTTEPYPRQPKPRVLLSLTAGTDQMRHWEVLKATAGNQSNFVVMPCGHVRGRCGCEATAAADAAAATAGPS